MGEVFEGRLSPSGATTDAAVNPMVGEGVNHMSPDEITRARNEKAGHALCKRCGGTGNQLYSMYQCCRDCCGTGIAVHHGELSRLAKWWAEKRERRERKALERKYRGPRDWTAWFHLRLSRWFGIGQWFKDGTDNCHRCGVWPSDVDYMMKRVRPFRAECLDRDSCDECVAEDLRYATDQIREAASRPSSVNDSGSTDER